MVVNWFLYSAFLLCWSIQSTLYNTPYLPIHIHSYKRSIYHSHIFIQMNTSERNLAKDTLAPEQPGIEPPTSHLVDDLNSKKGDNEKRIWSTSDSFSTCCSLSTHFYCHSLLIFIKLLDYWRFLGCVYAVKTNTYHCLRSNTDPLKTEDDRTVSVKP